MSTEKLLRKARAVLIDVDCQASGCYAAAGHRPACIRGRAEKVVEDIDWELERIRQMGVSAELAL